MLQRIVGYIRTFFILLIRSASYFKDSNPLIYSAATAFFCTFSISPIIVILHYLLSLYFEEEVMKKELFNILTGTFGAETSGAIKTIVENFHALDTNWFVTVGGFVFLIFVATTLLHVVKQALNHIWQVRRKHVNVIRYNFVERVKAAILILLIGVLFITSFFLDSSVSLLHDYFHRVIPRAHGVVHFISDLIGPLIVTAWFTMLFKIFADARVHISVAFLGGLLTSSLFMCGKWVLARILLYSSVVTIFGASASFALILLFIFYSSIILYYGASFTYLLGIEMQKPIKPGKYSDRYEIKVIGED